MAYVRRDTSGRIESVHRAATADAVEYLDASDPELTEFLREEFGPKAGPPDATSLLPILEEVLRLLLAKGLVALDELSVQAQATWSHFLEVQRADRAARFSASGFVEVIDDSAFGSLADPP